MATNFLELSPSEKLATSNDIGLSETDVLYSDWVFSPGLLEAAQKHFAQGGFSQVAVSSHLEIQLVSSGGSLLYGLYLVSNDQSSHNQVDFAGIDVQDTKAFVMDGAMPFVYRFAPGNVIATRSVVHKYILGAEDGPNAGTPLSSSTDVNEHVTDNDSHVTKEEKTKWNGSADFEHAHKFLLNDSAKLEISNDGKVTIESLDTQLLTSVEGTVCLPQGSGVKLKIRVEELDESNPWVEILSIEGFQAQNVAIDPEDQSRILIDNEPFATLGIELEEFSSNMSTLPSNVAISGGNFGRFAIRVWLGGDTEISGYCTWKDVVKQYRVVSSKEVATNDTVANQIAAALQDLATNGITVNGVLYKLTPVSN